MTNEEILQQLKLIDKMIPGLHLRYAIRRLSKNLTIKPEEIRMCRFKNCNNPIIKRNKSGICTKCWNEVSEEVTRLLEDEGFYKRRS